MEIIPKIELKEGYFYIGICRNTYVAQWVKNRFRYIKPEFSGIIDYLPHFDDIKHLPIDGFVPLEEIENPKLLKGMKEYLKEIGY